MSLRTASVGLNLSRAGASRYVLANRVVLRSLVAKRFVQTEQTTNDEALEILNSQRLKRPSSPHMTIYQPQLTWIGSIANRITGVGLSVLLYGFSIAYVTAPAFGLPFDTAAVVSLVQGMPEWLKISGKAILAAPFAFHSFNGLRHLGWDVGKLLSLKGAYRSGYAVLGATAITTVALVLI